MKTFLVFACFISVTTIYAQQWVGTVSSNWNTAGNWNPASVPTASSTVSFDVASPPNNCILTSAVTIGTFNQSAGSFSLGSGGSLTVNATFTVSGGTFNAGNGVLSVPNNFFRISGGLFNGNTATVHLGGPVNLDNVASLSPGTSTVYFDGALDQNLTINYVTTPHIAPLYKMILNKPGTTLRFNQGSTDSVAVIDSIILMDGKLQGSGILRASNNVWVQPGFDGSATTLTFAGTNNSILRLDTIFATDPGSNIIINKTTPATTVSFIRANPTDTVRTGNSNANLEIINGTLMFPDNPPVQIRFANIFIRPGGILSATANYFYNRGNHINTGGTFLHNNGTYVFYQSFFVPTTTQFFTHTENFFNVIVDLPGGQFNLGPNDTLITNGQLTLRAGTIAGDNICALNAKGNFSFETGMSPTLTNTKLVFSGTTDQNVGFAAGREDYWNAGVTVNKPSGKLILNSPWILDDFGQFFTFVKGVVSIPDATNDFLYLKNFNSVTGANSASYVDGPVQFQWFGDFTFPLGNNGFYAPVKITNTNNELVTAQYFHADPGTIYDSTKKDASLQNISKSEYWMITKAGANSVHVSLSYENLRSGGVGDATKLRIARWTGTQWEDRGNFAEPPNFIRTTNPLTSFSPFTLASTDQLANPLPVHLISFTALEKDGYNLLEWTADNEENFDAYIIESGSNGTNFTSIGNVKAVADGLLHNYSFNDAAPGSKTFYRLKLLDRNGHFEYSNVVVVNRAVDKLSIVVSPNPGRGHFTLKITSDFASAATIKLSDVQGKLLGKQETQIKTGVNSFDLKMGELPQGIYFIEVKTSRGERQVQKYVVTK